MNEVKTVQALVCALNDLVNWMPRVEPANGQQPQVDASIERACAVLVSGRALIHQLQSTPAAVQAELSDERIDTLASAHDMDKTVYENYPARCWRNFARSVIQADRELRTPKEGK